MHTLTIRYANPETTPARHGARGYGVNVPMVQPHVNDGWWQLTGPREALAAHVAAAMAAQDVNDYAIR